MQISELADHGFDVATAMELCINDEDIYREVLETALEEGREKLAVFEEAFNAGDFDRYVIEAHGLKNAAKQIGANELSELAKASEFDGKAGKTDDVRARHPQLMEKYKEVLDLIAQLF